MSDTRLPAALLLQDILENKRFAADARERFKDAGDSAFANMLVQTALRHLTGIRQILKRFASKKLPPKAHFASYALILGTTEAFWLDTPDYAVINSWVELAKARTDKYVSGFVNAVLRKICAQKEVLRPQAESVFFPPEFRRLLNASYGKKTVSAIEKAALLEPELDITVKSGVEISGAVVLPLGTRRCKNNGAVAKLAGYNEGLWWVQDFSSALPVRLLDRLQGSRVLDLCAAPGGKTAQLIAAGAKVDALDISSARLKRLRQNLQASDIICADAVDWLQNFTGAPYDLVLLDAPCSATGTLRRHPELVHIKNLHDVEALAATQKKLLDLAAEAVCADGRLVYCTCSLSKAEGEDRINDFLQTHADFKTLPAALPAELHELKTPEGWVRILPSHLAAFGGADGFFAAVLKKEA